jgi:hypothetical protein
MQLSAYPTFHKMLLLMTLVRLTRGGLVEVNHLIGRRTTALP